MTLNPGILSKAGIVPGFFKMAGGGNDFIVMDNRGGGLSDSRDLIARMCARRLSIGADGLILIEPSARATFRMRYFNSDGGRADFCGNGTRCAARFAFMNVIAPRKMTIETDAGVIGAEVHEQRVTLSLPAPQSFRPRVELEAGGMTLGGSYLVVGVPHYVVFLTGDLWRHDIAPLGSAVRRHPALGEAGANVDFVTVAGRNEIEVRTYERGVEGETLSCGSGVVASALVSALFDRVDSPVSVLTRSGIRLQVGFTRDGDEVRDVTLSGDARVIYKGTTTAETTEGFDLDWLIDPTNQRPGT